MLYHGVLISQEGTLITETYNVTTTDSEGHETILHEQTYSKIQTASEDSRYWQPITRNVEIDKKHSFTGITVKNNKCYCYPYNYLLVTNNNGAVNTYKYEDFSTAKCVFEGQYVLSVGCSGRAVPKNYKGIAENIDESISLSKYPTCQWSSDSYTNWLTQNAVNIEKQNINIGFTGVKAVAGVVGNLANLSLGGAIMSAVDSAQTLSNQVMDLKGQFHTAELLPEQLGGSAQGDVNFSSGDTTFKFFNMRAKNEYMYTIDDYFSKFGYKVLTIKQPNILSRERWNYLQIGAGEIFATGNIPQDDLATINAICQKGVTIWHVHNSIGNYALSNTIV